MKTIKYLLVVLLTTQFVAAQSIVIDAGASIDVATGADICAQSYGNITGTLTGGGTQCGQLPLPVELSVFTATLVKNEINLFWKTETEIDNFGFDVERRIDEKEWIKISFINGHGNSNSPKEYNYTDKDLFAGGSKFQYRLKQIDTDGIFEYSDVVEVEVVPDRYELSQNYPNPFNPSTAIQFSLPKQTQLKINIYNMLGEQIATIADGVYETGNYKITFNASSLPSGTYIYRLESSDFVQVKKMILLK